MATGYKDLYLVMFSGGLDSTYLLHHLLINTDALIHSHHIEIVTLEDRWRQENLAIQRIYKHLHSTGCRSFTTSSSRYVFKSFNKYLGPDEDVTYLHAKNVVGNLVLLNPGYYVTVVLGVVKDDLLSPVVQERIKNRVYANLWSSLRHSLDPSQQRMVSPLIKFPLVQLQKFKRDLLKEISPSLLSLIHSCRRPTPVGPCGKCHPCNQVRFRSTISS